MEFFQTFLTSLFSLGDPSASSVSIPTALEFAAVLAGAVSGALCACSIQLDLIGVCVLAIASSLGGGVVRDMILSNQGVYMLDHPEAVLACLAVALLAFFFASAFKRFERAISLFDIVSVALFTVTGADKALVAGYGVFAGIMLGMLTAVGGGVVRDVMVGRVPAIFRASNFYAVCTFAGASVYSVLAESHMVKGWAAVLGIFTVLLLRYLSLRFDWQTCAPIDLIERYGHRLDNERGLQDTTPGGTQDKGEDSRP